MNDLKVICEHKFDKCMRGIQNQAVYVLPTGNFSGFNTIVRPYLESKGCEIVFVHQSAEIPINPARPEMVLLDEIGLDYWTIGPQARRVAQDVSDHYREKILPIADLLENYHWDAADVVKAKLFAEELRSVFKKGSENV